MSLQMKAIVVGDKELIAKIKGKASKIANGLTDALKKGAILVEGDVKKSMRGTGTPHTPSRPGEPPAVMTGKLRASIMHEVKKGIGGDIEARIGIKGGTQPDTKNYGLFLEFGTSRMPKRPYLKPALAKNLKTIANFITRAVKGATR